MSIVFCAQYSWPSEYSSLLLKQSVDKALSLSGKSTLLNVLHLLSITLEVIFYNSLNKKYITNKINPLYILILHVEIEHFQYNFYLCCTDHQYCMLGIHQCIPSLVTSNLLTRMPAHIHFPVFSRQNSRFMQFLGSLHIYNET